MCPPNGSTNATVRTPDSKPTSIDKPMGAAPRPTGALTDIGFANTPPGDPPTELDDEVRRRRAMEMNRLMLGFGRRSMFSFSEGDSGTPLLSRKSLTGKS